jgi:hypothetical protein
MNDASPSETPSRAATGRSGGERLVELLATWEADLFADLGELLSALRAAGAQLRSREKGPWRADLERIVTAELPLDEELRERARRTIERWDAEGASDALLETARELVSTVDQRLEELLGRETAGLSREFRERAEQIPARSLNEALELAWRAGTPQHLPDKVAAMESLLRARGILSDAGSTSGRPQPEGERAVAGASHEALDDPLRSTSASVERLRSTAAALAAQDLRVKLASRACDHVDELLQEVRKGTAVPPSVVASQLRHWDATLARVSTLLDGSGGRERRDRIVQALNARAQQLLSSCSEERRAELEEKLSGPLAALQGSREQTDLPFFARLEPAVEAVADGAAKLDDELRAARRRLRKGVDELASTYARNAAALGDADREPIRQWMEAAEREMTTAGLNRLQGLQQELAKHMTALRRVERQAESRNKRPRRRTRGDHG